MVSGWMVCVAIAVFGQGPTEPELLVRKLGAPKYTERESASASLQQLGREALPALRRGIDDRDLEIRARSAALIERIEGSLLLEPSMVRLDFDDTPLDEAIRSISRQTGLNVRLMSELNPALAKRPLTLRQADPIPFWRAMDLVSEAARLEAAHLAPGLDGTSSPSIVLFARTGRPIPPKSDHGPFRVRLMAISYQHDLQYPDGPPPITQRPFTGSELPADHDPTGAEQFHLRLSLVGEPRLGFALNGGIQLTEARDERGQSLLPNDQQRGTIQSTAYVGMNSNPSLQLRVDLVRPEHVGRRIKVLKGSIPVVVSSRRADPLTVDLKAAVGKTSKNRLASLTVHSIKPTGALNQNAIEISILDERTSDSTAVDAFGSRVHVDGSWFELLDAQGKKIPWYFSSTSLTGAESRHVLTTLPGGSAGSPATIKYYGTIRRECQIPFEFRDLPMPGQPIK